MWEGRIIYSACDLLQTEKSCSGAAIEVALVEILSPDIPFILSHMLLSVYYQNNVWPVQKYKKAKFFLLVLQTM